MSKESCLESCASSFRCEHCGTCCQVGGNPLMFESDKQRILAFLKEHPSLDLKVAVYSFSTDPVTYKFMRSAPCPMWDRSSRLCRIYEARPDSCRSYPFWLLEDHGRVFQDLFICRGAVRSLADHFDIPLF